MKLLRITTALFFASLIPASTFAASATGDVSAKIIAGISISQNAGKALDFGTIASSDVAGTAKSSSAVTGGVIRLANGKNGEFAISGDPGRNFVIDSSADTSATLTGAVTGSKLTAALVYPPSPQVTDVDGNYTLVVQGTLTVPANAVPDSYTGTYNVVVHY